MLLLTQLTYTRPFKNHQWGSSGCQKWQTLSELHPSISDSSCSSKIRSIKSVSQITKPKTVLRNVQCPCSSCAIMKSLEQRFFYERMPFLASTTCVGCSIKTGLILTFQAKNHIICVHSFYTKHQNNNYILNRHLVATYDIPE